MTDFINSDALDEIEDELEEFEEETEEEELLDGDLTSTERVELMAHAASAVRAEDIIVLDLRELTIIADFFLICTGKSSIQIRAISNRIEEWMGKRGIKRRRVEGYQEATWILMDYGDIIVHIMAAEQREYFRLEEFWSGAKRLAIDLDEEPLTLNSEE